MTNAYQDAARDLQRLSKMFNGLVALGPELERVGSLPQAAEEAQERINKLKLEEAAHKKALDKIAEKHAEADAVVKKKIDDGEAKAAKILQEARDFAGGAQGVADKMRAQLKAEGEKILADAQAAADKLMTKTQTAVFALEERIKKANAEAVKAEADAAATKGKLDAAKNELAQLKARISA